MSQQKIFLPSILLVLLIISCFYAQATIKSKPVVIAYVGGYRGLLNTDSIDVQKLSHINYAFVDIKDNKAWLHNLATDTINLRKLSELKLQNPSLKILISIGGWIWSKHFSDAVLTDTSRKKFAESAVAIVATYHLDGVDIDWEYPGMIGDSNTYRPQDKQNYTLMFKSIRKELDSLSKITKQHYFVTTAVGGSKEYIAHTEMNKVQRFTDFINIMSYDYADASDTISKHHANLYNTNEDTGGSSADKSIHAFLKAGVPASKIVMGIAFYGKGFKMQSAENNGFLRKTIASQRGGGFTFLKDSIINQNGYVRYWDNNAKAPYLFNPKELIFITYDDEASVLAKCRYVQKNKLAGVMFWEYSSDQKGYLLNEISKAFGYDK